MASSRRTYDTDTITLRQVFAKNGNNTNIPALRVLTADGAGGTYWAIPSTLGATPAFNQIITSAGTYTADLSYNRFRLLAGENMGMYDGPPGSNQTTLFAKAYSQIDVSGENTLLAFANGNLDPSLKIAGEGGIQVRADPATNTLFIDGPAPPVFIVSTGIYGFNQIKVTDATSTITSSVQGFDGNFLTADSPSTLLRFLGYNDIQLSTNVTTNSVYFTISTFNSKDYLNISNAAFSAYPSSMSTVSSTYVRLDQFYSSIGFFSSQTGFGFSSVVSSINALAMSTGSNFYILSGLINERLTIAQFLQYVADDKQTLNSTMASTVTGLGTAGYISTSQLTSTLRGLGSAGYLSSVSLASASQEFLTSSLIGLGTLGYISSLSLSDQNLFSTVEGLGSAGYVSSLSTIITSSIFNTGAISTFDLEVYGSNTFSVRGNAFFRGPVSISTVNISSINGCNADQLGTTIPGVVSTSFLNTTLISSIKGLGTASYASTSFVGASISSFSTAIGGVAPGFPSTVSTSYARVFNTSNLKVSTIDKVNINTSNPNLWIAVGRTGSGSFQNIQYSYNGSNWFYTNGNFDNGGQAVAYNGQIWVAVGADATQNNRIKYSYDGFNWFPSRENGFQSVFGIEWNGRMWIAVGATGGPIASTIEYSYDGINWSSSAGTGFSQYGNSISWNGRMWVAVGYDSTANATIQYSYNGINWLYSSNGGFNGSTKIGYDVAWNGFMWVAIGDDDNVQNNTLKYSYDGINWSNSLGTGFNLSGRAIAWNGRMWVAGGLDSVQNNTLKYSYDGITWLNSLGTGFGGVSFLKGAYDIAWNGKLWIAVGKEDSPTSTIKLSTDGINWSNATSIAQFDEVKGIAFSSNTLPSYAQENLIINPQGIPIFNYSTNNIFVMPSSMIINDTLIIDEQWRRVGVNCNIPQYNLDVAGSVNVSSFFINTSSFNTILTSTVAGVGVGLNAGNIISTVAGLGSAGYISSPQLVSSMGGISVFLSQNITSTTRGLGSLGYISSSQLVSTVASLASSSSFPSTISTSYGQSFTTSLLNVSTVSYLNVFPSTQTLWVAMGQATIFNNISYSLDGINWLRASGSFRNTGFGVAFNGKMWVGVGFDTDDSNRNILFSYDGINWVTSVSGAFTSVGYDVAWNGRMWVAVGSDNVINNTIKYSYDGMNWSNSLGAGFGDTVGKGIAWNGTMWIAVGQESSANGTIKYSYDGIQWSNVLSGGFASFSASGVVWNGRMWVAVGSGSVNTTIKYSYDGLNWSNSASGGFSSSGSKIAWNGRMFVALGNDAATNNRIKYSLDGLNWSNALTGSFATSGYGISWNGSLWVATGTDTLSNGNIKYSSDGINWRDSTGDSFTANGYGVGYSSNTTPSYNQNNLSILPQNIPIFLTSTNTIFAQPSSLVINDCLIVDKQFDRVGVNCNIPQYSLDVAGSLNTSSFFINTSSFTTILTSTVAGIGTGSGLTQANLTSSIVGLGTVGYISTSQLISTVAGIGSGGGTAGFPSTVSTSYSIAFNTSSLTTSTINFVNVPPSSSNLWVVVGSDSTQNNRIKYSYDGITWLNSAGSAFTGYGNAVAFNGTMWVAVGADATQNNRIKYSYDGINWLNSAGTGFGNNGNGVAWNGRLWVAVGYDATQNNTIKYSLDGITWSNSAGTGFSVWGNGIAWNGQIWVAVGYDATQNNTIKYSVNGINWSNSAGTGFTTQGWNIAWNGRLWVAVGEDATPTNTIKYSVNGINWSNSAGAGFTRAYGVAWNGRLWVAVGVDPTQTIKYSLDGINWLNSAAPQFITAGLGIAWNGTLWVASGQDSFTQNNTLKYSVDGINWSNSSGTGFTSYGYGIAFSSNTIPSYNQTNFSIQPQNIPIFITSTNTIFAQPSSMILNNTMIIDGQWDRVGINCNIPQYSLDVAGSLNTSSFFINTSSFTRILTSTVAGVTSGASSAAFPSTVSTMYGSNFAGSNIRATFLFTSTVASLVVEPRYPTLLSQNNASNIFVAVGTNSSNENQALLWSRDGFSWFNANGTGFFYGAYGVAWNERMFIAVGGAPSAFGSNYTIKYSLDGRFWTNVTTGGFATDSSNAGRGVAWNGSMWVAVGYSATSNATIQYSFNGLNWSNTTGGFANNLGGFGVAWNGTMWVAVGQDSTSNGAIKYSYNGYSWSNATGTRFSWGNGVAWNGLYWVAVGQDGTRVNTILNSSNGINWSPAASGSFLGEGRGVAWNGTMWVAVGSNAAGTNILYSADGSNWLNTDTNFQTIGRGITWNGQRWAAVGLDTTSSNACLKYSFNGINWSNSQTATSEGWSIGVDQGGNGVCFTSNIISFRQSNLDMIYANTPIYIRSTNQIFATPSSLVINDSLYIDKTWKTIGVNCNLPRYNLDVAGSGSFSTLTITGGAIVASTNTDFALTVFGTQGVARVGGTTWTAISDQRVKENIVSADLDRCYSDIKNIPLRRFTYTSTFFQDYNLKDKNVLGFIAQEVSTVQPKAITVSPGFGFSDMMWLNIDQLNMSLYGSVKKLIQDKEAADSTIRGQAFHLETLTGRMETMFSTLEGLQGR